LVAGRGGRMRVMMMRMPMVSVHAMTCGAESPARQVALTWRPARG
jgi:hypothetical protein